MGMGGVEGAAVRRRPEGSAAAGVERRRRSPRGMGAGPSAGSWRDSPENSSSPNHVVAGRGEAVWGRGRMVGWGPARQAMVPERVPLPVRPVGGGAWRC